MAQDHEHFMRIALEEAAKGGAEGNIAVGSIIVRGDSIIGRGRNVVTSTHDSTAHAETVALWDAERALGQEEALSGCTLYTTSQPCAMCAGAIMVSGISTLVIGRRPGPSDTRWGDYTVEKLVEMMRWGDRLKIASPDVLAQECAGSREEWAVKNKDRR